MHQRLRVMGLTVLAVAASAVLLGGSSASHAELAGGPALTQNSDPVGLMACNLLAIQILEKSTRDWTSPRLARECSKTSLLWSS